MLLFRNRNSRTYNRRGYRTRGGWIRQHNKRGFGIQRAFGGYFRPIGRRGVRV